MGWQTRLSLGSTKYETLLGEFQLGYKWLPFAAGDSFPSGMHLGGEIRMFDELVQASGVSCFNVTPQITTGWLFSFGQAFVDLRLSWIFAVVSAPTRAVGRCAASTTWLAPRAKGWGASSGTALLKLRNQLFLPVRPRPRTSRVSPDRNPRALPCHSVAVLIKARPLSPSISTSRGSSLWLHEQDPMLRSLGRAERLSQSTPLAPREGTAR